MLNVENVYVVHYTRLLERRINMDSFFRQNKIKANYIYQFDKDELDDDQIDEYYLCNKEEYDRKIYSAYKENFVEFRKLRMAEISCTIKHYHAIKRISEECKEYGLIFEDDVIFKENFVEKFNEFLDKTPKDWDAIFFGNCCKLDVENKQEGKVAYLKQHPATKCADGYLIKTNIAKKITETMKPFVTISDWELAYQLYLHDAKVYWWSPTLVSQGSETGLYKTTLR